MVKGDFERVACFSLGEFTLPPCPMGNCSRFANLDSGSSIAISEEPFADLASLLDKPVFGRDKAFAALAVGRGTGDLQGAEFFDLGKHGGDAVGVFFGEIVFFAWIGIEFVEFESEVISGMEGVAFDDELPGAEVQGG